MNTFAYTARDAAGKKDRVDGCTFFKRRLVSRDKVLLIVNVLICSRTAEGDNVSAQ